MGVRFRVMVRVKLYLQGDLQSLCDHCMPQCQWVGQDQLGKCLQDRDQVGARRVRVRVRDRWQRKELGLWLGTGGGERVRVRVRVRDRDRWR